MMIKKIYFFCNDSFLECVVILLTLPPVVWWLSCLPLDQRFAGLSSAEDNGFLKAIKIRSATFIGGKVKPAVPCRSIYRYVKEPYSMKEILRRKNSPTFLAKFLLLWY
jgi:hypothetical protein